MTAADVNSDGKPDLVTANDHRPGNTVLVNATEPGEELPAFAARPVRAAAARSR